MRRIINFGMFAIEDKSKDDEITVEIELKEENGRKVFSACGTVYNRKRYEYIMGGQCLDELYKYIGGNKKFKEIYRLWKLYHLNDMHAGTKEQEKAIEDARKNGIIEGYDYNMIKDYLKSINLYEVEYQGKPYKYGYGWLYEEIPTKDIKIIKKIIKEV